MRKIALEAVATLALGGAEAPACLEAQGPLRPVAVRIEVELERDEVWRIHAGRDVRLWWKRVVVPRWKRPFSLFVRSRSRREACGLELLRQRALPAPRICACVEWRPRHLLKESALITYDVTGARPLNAFLRDEPSAVRRFAACAATGRLVARLHEAGLAHFRLFAKNLLVDPQDPERVWLLDAPYLCAWRAQPPSPVRRYDLATLCSRYGELDLAQAGVLLREYSRCTGVRWDERRIAGAPRWRLKLRRISLYLASIWRGHRADRYVVMPREQA